MIKLTNSPLELARASQAEMKTDLKQTVDQLMEVFKTNYEESKEKLPYSEIEGQIRSKLENTFESCDNRFIQGYAILLDDAWQNKKNLLPYLAKIDKQAEREEGLKTGQPLWEILGLHEDAISTFYTTALYLLEHKRYEEASHAFFCLSFLSPNIAPIWQGLARSEWALNRKEEALNAYQAALLVEGNNFHLYSEAIRCAVECQNGKTLAEFLNIAIEYAEQHPEESASKALQQSALKLKQEFSWILNQEGG